MACHGLVDVVFGQFGENLRVFTKPVDSVIL